VLEQMQQLVLVLVLVLEQLVLQLRRGPQQLAQPQAMARPR